MLQLHLRPQLDAVLERQHNLATRLQVLVGGVTDMTICRRVRAGTWQRVLPGVYLVEPGRLTPEQRRVAAALFTGPEAQLTGLSALHWYGFRHAPSTDRVHMNVPHTLRRRSTGFLTVQRTLTMDERERDVGLYRVTSVPRAVVDAGRFSTQLRDVRAVVAEAVQRGLASPAALDEEIRRAARSRTALVRRALVEVVNGAQSAPEAELQNLVATSRILPEVLWNVRLLLEDGTPLPTPDGWITGAAIALEVDSRQYHSEGEGWLNTLERSTRLGEYGIVVLHFTPAQIRSGPREVLHTIEQTYRSRPRFEPPVIVLRRDPS